MGIPVLYLRAETGQIIAFERAPFLLLRPHTWKPWLEEHANMIPGGIWGAVVVIATIMALYLGGRQLVREFWPWLMPTHREGAFSIAVADFSERGDVPESLQNIDELLFEYLRTDLARQDIGHSLGPVVVRGPRETGPSPTGRRGLPEWLFGVPSDPKQRAERLGADGIVCDTVSFSDTVASVSTQLHWAPQTDYETKEIIGTYSTMSTALDTSTGARWEDRMSDTLAREFKAFSLLVMGLWSLSDADYEEAQDRFKQVLKLELETASWDETQEVLFGLMGHCALRLGHLEEAEKFCRKAIESNQDYPRGYLCLGHVYNEGGNLDSATESYLAAVNKAEAGESDHGNVAGLAHLGLGIVYVTRLAQLLPQNPIFDYDANQVREWHRLARTHLVSALEDLCHSTSDYPNGVYQGVVHMDYLTDELCSGDEEVTDSNREAISLAYATLGRAFEMTGDHKAQARLYETAFDVGTNPETRALWADQIAWAFWAWATSEEDREEAANWYGEAFGLYKAAFEAARAPDRKADVAQAAATSYHNMGWIRATDTYTATLDSFIRKVSIVTGTLRMLKME